HCSAVQSMNASCTGSSRSPAPARPSTVEIPAPSASTANVVHALTGLPSTSTVHAPQTCVSQLTLVPFKPCLSRRNSAKVSRFGTGSSTLRPLTLVTISVSYIDRLLHLRDGSADEHPCEVTLVLLGPVQVLDHVQARQDGIEVDVVYRRNIEWLRPLSYRTDHDPRRAVGT